MAVFIAAFALNNETLSVELASQLKVILAPAGSVELHQQGRCAIAHADLGLWPGPSSTLQDRRFAVVGGDPVLRDGTQTLPRHEGIGRLVARLETEGAAALRDADGSFAGLMLDSAGGQLRVFTDKLGVRPVYWIRTDRHVFAASSLWALLAVPGLSKDPDWRAAAETAAFGFPLGDRTLVSQIQVLGPGHCLSMDRDGCRSECYWDWRELRPSGLKGQALLTHIEAAFHDAVDRRLGHQRSVMAFLSGGMDSRLIVSRLRANEVCVHSLNFAPAGSQDLAFGRMVADRLGCRHFEFDKGELGFTERQTAAWQAWREANVGRTDRPEQARLVWSGDGGSVALGHVYLTTSIVSKAREQGLEAAAKALQLANKNKISARFLRGPWQHLTQAPLQGMVEDLRSRPRLEIGRNCHLFFMLNDQRRHLSRHFETIHEHRLDLVLPFFDARFIEAVLSSPIDEFLEHRLYNELMARLPSCAGQIPWQAYPGHLPCPHPIEEGLRRQWEDGWFDAGTARRRNRKLLRHRLAQLMHAGSATQVIRRPLAAGIALAGMAGFNRFQYLLENCVPFLESAELSDEIPAPGGQ